jgi:DNA-binding NarL/FixJ family response regulator
MAMTDSPTTQSSPIRVLIVDDHEIVRQGLRTFLELQDNAPGLPIEVAGEAADGAEAVALSARLQPDVILLDLVMPVMDGITAIPQIVARAPRARIIILTSFGEEARIFPALRAGAHGYLLKDVRPDDLVRAIRSAQLGWFQLYPDVGRKLVAAATEETPATGNAGPAADLTGREREVLRLLAAGRSNREIAAELVIGQTTVKSHVSSILDKLHLEDRTQAAIYALRHGLAANEP